MTAHSSESTKSYAAGEVIRFILAALIFIAPVVFCLANTNKVHVDYLFGKKDVPLIVVMAGSGVAGILIDALIRRSRR
jgi:uncharacterized integral membrane protein